MHVTIDADKPSYDKYYECLLTIMKPGGIILFDNILRMARVADLGVCAMFVGMD